MSTALDPTELMVFYQVSRKDGVDKAACSNKKFLVKGQTQSPNPESKVP